MKNCVDSELNLTHNEKSKKNKSNFLFHFLNNFLKYFFILMESNYIQFIFFGKLNL